MEFDAFENESPSLSGGAGIQSAQFVDSKGAKVVITGNCGPNAVKTLDAAGIKLFAGQSGTVKEAVEDLKNNALNASNEANVPDHFGVRDGEVTYQEGFGSTGLNQYSSFGMGMGGGRGKGLGRGMGMGGGRGMGRGMGISAGNEFNNAPKTLSREEEVNLLKKQSEELLRQAGDIQTRINQLEKND